MVEIKLTGNRSAVISGYIPMELENLIRRFTPSGIWKTKIGRTERTLIYPLAAKHPLHVSFDTAERRGEFMATYTAIMTKIEAVWKANRKPFAALETFLTDLIGEPESDKQVARYFQGDTWILTLRFDPGHANVQMQRAVPAELKYPLVGYFTVHNIAYETTFFTFAKA